jgi:hypothetical protein
MKANWEAVPHRTLGFLLLACAIVMELLAVYLLVETSDGLASFSDIGERNVPEFVLGAYRRFRQVGFWLLGHGLGVGTSAIGVLRGEKWGRIALAVVVTSVTASALAFRLGPGYMYIPRPSWALIGSFALLSGVTWFSV